jgi:hypothetical protein
MGVNKPVRHISSEKSISYCCKDLTISEDMVATIHPTQQTNKPVIQSRPLASQLPSAFAGRSVAGMMGLVPCS